MQDACKDQSRSGNTKKKEEDESEHATKTHQGRRPFAAPFVSACFSAPAHRPPRRPRSLQTLATHPTVSLHPLPDACKPSLMSPRSSAARARMRARRRARRASQHRPPGRARARFPLLGRLPSPRPNAPAIVPMRMLIECARRASLGAPRVGGDLASARAPPGCARLRLSPFPPAPA